MFTLWWIIGFLCCVVAGTLLGGIKNAFQVHIVCGIMNLIGVIACFLAGIGLMEVAQKGQLPF